MFDRGGLPIELLSTEDWRSAIKKRHLTRETTVTVVDEEGGSVVSSAGEVPQLRAIFDELSPETAERVREEAPPITETVSFQPPSSAAKIPPRPQPGSGIPSMWDEAARETRREEFLAEQPAQPEPTSGLLAAGAVVALLLLALFVIGRCSPTDGGEQPNTSTTVAITPGDVGAGTGSAVRVARPSFDCRRVRAGAERAVCGSERLSELDRKMASAYERLLHRAARSDRAGIRAEQRAWLRSRQGCATTDDVASCLEQLYLQRLPELEKRPTRSESAEPVLVRKRVSDVKPAAPAARDNSDILCVLPEGSETRLSLEQCRARAGVVLGN
jgi:uncharacterized protein YecT (DUF1311 family)